MNNRKQQINSFLNGLTTKEIDTYLKENEVNKDNMKLLEILEKHKQYKNEGSHLQKLYNEAYNNINDLFLLGRASVIAAILYYGLQKDFDIKDFVKMYNQFMNDDIKLKEYVYEMMKDF